MVLRIFKRWIGSVLYAAWLMFLAVSDLKGISVAGYAEGASQGDTCKKTSIE
jgi:hypothetical protein